MGEQTANTYYIVIKAWHGNSNTYSWGLETEGTYQCNSHRIVHNNKIVEITG